MTRPCLCTWRHLACKTEWSYHADNWHYNILQWWDWVKCILPPFSKKSTRVPKINNFCIRYVLPVLWMTSRFHTVGSVMRHVYSWAMRAYDSGNVVFINSNNILLNDEDQQLHVESCATGSKSGICDCLVWHEAQQQQQRSAVPEIVSRMCECFTALSHTDRWDNGLTELRGWLLRQRKDAAGWVDEMLICQGSQHTDRLDASSRRHVVLSSNVHISGRLSIASTTDNVIPLQDTRAASRDLVAGLYLSGGVRGVESPCTQQLTSLDTVKMVLKFLNFTNTVLHNDIHTHTHSHEC